MALKFGDAKGTAQKTSLTQYAYVEGDNKVRMVGDILLMLLNPLQVQQEVC